MLTSTLDGSVQLESVDPAYVHFGSRLVRSASNGRLRWPLLGALIPPKGPRPPRSRGFDECPELRGLVDCRIWRHPALPRRWGRRDGAPKGGEALPHYSAKKGLGTIDYEARISRTLNVTKTSSRDDVPSAD